MILSKFTKILFAALGGGGLLCNISEAATTTYTWDFSSASAVMGGTASGTFTTTEVEGKGLVLTNSTFAERGTTGLDFREMLNGATSGNGTLSFSMGILWNGSNSLQNILHVGRNQTGFSLGLSNGIISVNGGNLASGGAIAGAQLTSGTWTNVTVDIFQQEVKVTLNDGTSTSVHTSTMPTINWYTGSDDGGDTQNQMYCIGYQAPGWTQQPLNGTELRAFSVTYTTVPEPSAATLSLLALSGLALRRRK